MFDVPITLVTKWWRGQLLPLCANTRLRMLIDKAEMTDRFFWKRKRSRSAGAAK